MELASRLFPAFPLLELKAMRITPEAVTLVLTPTTAVGVCPACGQSSTRVHSHYHRFLQDVPAHGRAVRLELHLRRFFCDLPGCPQDTFAERLPQIAESHARKTSRLVESLRETAFTAGGEAGSRLAGQLGMPASGDTLLRLLRRADVPDMANTPKVLGVDDWAIRRGQTYGTILCDLESHRPVDLLPERSSEVLAAWLRKHPGAEIISRDRGGDYAKGASAGAPAAIQVADRWHLLHNLTDALQRAVDRQQSLLTEIAREVAARLAPTPAPTTASPAGDAASSPPAPLSRAEQGKLNSRARRLERYQQVQELRRQGMSLCKICQTLQMSRATVKRFAHSDQFPERATPNRRNTPLDPFLPCLQERWEQGCDHVGQLWREIKAKGFTGSVYMVCRQVRRWRRACGIASKTGTKQSTRSVRIIRPSARRIAWLALGHVSVPTAQDEATLKAICQRWPELQESAELARQFASLLKEHDASSLEAWIQLTQEPLIFPEVRRFGEVLRQDWAAVVQAIHQPWSQGQVEGQINRLKMIKRQMYGRANFDLLRQRVLHKKAA
jgi:transposase